MRLSERPVDERELVAFAEGRLGRREALRVAAHLREHPADADRVRAYIGQDARLRKLYDPVLDEPVPARLRHLVEPAPEPARLRLALVGALGTAAALALVGLALVGFGLAAGTDLRLPFPSPSGETRAAAPSAGAPGSRAVADFVDAVLADRAAEQDAARGGSALAGAGPEAAPVEAPEASLAAAAPDLGGLGLQLQSVRERRRAGLGFTEYAYRDAGGAAVTLYEAHPDAADLAGRGDDGAVLRVVEHAGGPLVEWSQGGRHYALVGEGSIPALTRLALRARESLPRPALAGLPESAPSAASGSGPQVPQVRGGPELRPAPAAVPSTPDPVVDPHPRTQEM